MSALPKDITHWIIAEEIYENLENEEIKKIIARYKDLYYIGAISFDIPFFAVGKDSKKRNAISDSLHKNSSYSTLAKILGEKEVVSGAALAFLLGTISHIIVDSSFHPLIFYYTGDYHDKDNTKRKLAITKHREFESKLDLYFRNKIKLKNHYLMTNSYKNKKISKDELNSLLSREYAVFERLHNDEISSMLKSYMSFQYLFSSKVLYYTLKLINKFSKQDLSETIALFYPKKDCIDYSFYENNISYKHPVTGEDYNESILDIKERAVERSVSIFSLFANDGTRENLINVLKEIEIPNLDTDMVGVTSNEMKYFV